MEYRYFKNAELRAAGSHTLRGYAAVFNLLSEQLGNFRESIRPGAFTNTLAAGADVRALVDHDPSKILGRTVAGTLHLNQDSHGLLANIDLPNTSVGSDVYESVKRGDISQMSFGFKCIKDAWPTRDRRELLDVALIDVSIVTYPAYPQTSVAVRSDGETRLWYLGEDEPIVIPDVSEQERLKLRLRLAKQIQ